MDDHGDDGSSCSCSKSNQLRTLRLHPRSPIGCPRCYLPSCSSHLFHSIVLPSPSIAFWSDSWRASESRNSEFTLSTGFSNFNNETETPALTTLRRMIPQLEISQSTKPHHDPKNYSLTHKGGYRLCCVQSSKKTPNIFTILHILAFALYICTLSLFLLSASVLYHVRISMSLIKCQSYFILASSLDIFLMSPKQQLEDSNITLSVPPWKCICAKWHNIWAKCSGKWKECKFAPNKPWIVDYVLI